MTISVRGRSVILSSYTSKIKNIYFICLQMIPIDCFEGQSSDGRIVPIVPGGRSIPLTYTNRKQYVDRAVEFRLHEMDMQVRHLI